MSFSWSLQCSLTLCFLSIVQTVPPDYCLAPFNRGDCDAPPRQVFSYYKPGSRCELETWRGCPTLNKFENEYLCSINCIFRIRRPVIEKKLNPCDIPLNEEKCKNTSSLVYTHINGSCEPVQWSGCPSENKFISKSICEAVCQVPHKETMFVELDKEHLEEINEILDNIIEEEAIVSTKETETEPTQETETEPTKETETEPTKEVPTEATAVVTIEATITTPVEESSGTPATKSPEISIEDPAEDPLNTSQDSPEYIEPTGDPGLNDLEIS